MKKKLLPFLLILTMCAALLTGCGTQTPAGGASSQATVAESATEAGSSGAQEAETAEAQEGESASPEETEASGAFPFDLVTKDDQVVTFTHVPERILSTNPNTGEQLMAMGLGDKIIGTCYNNAKVAEQYQEAYEALPRIAEQYPSLEVVLELDPDFIYGRSSAFSEKDTAIATHDKLTEMGIMSLSSIEGYKLGCDLEDVYEDFHNLGRIFRAEDKAEEVVGGIQAQVSAVKEKIAGQETVRVFNFDAEMDGGVYTPGNNFTSKLIRHAGGVNIFEELENTWNTVSWEEVVELDPEVIIINDYGSTPLQEKIDVLNNTPSLQGITAVKNRNYVAVTLPEVFASTRVGDTIEKFAIAFHPECFE